MKTTVNIVIMAICFLFISITSASAIDTYIIGYKMGVLTSFHTIAEGPEYGTGQLLLGVETKMHNNINMWQFTITDSKLQRLLKNNVGYYVTLKYRFSIASNEPTYTKYDVIEVLPLCQVKNMIYNTSDIIPANISTMTIDGRFVETYNLVPSTKPHNILVQKSIGDNQFVEMACADETLYNGIINYLCAGRKAKITYVESYTKMGDTGTNVYNIIKIEPAGDIK